MDCPYQHTWHQTHGQLNQRQRVNKTEPIPKGLLTMPVWTDLVGDCIGRQIYQLSTVGGGGDMEVNG